MRTSHDINTNISPTNHKMHVVNGNAVCMTMQLQYDASIRRLLKQLRCQLTRHGEHQPTLSSQSMPAKTNDIPV